MSVLVMSWVEAPKCKCSLVSEKMGTCCVDGGTKT